MKRRRGGHLAAVQVLVQRGADINALDAQKQTPLYFAEKRWHSEVAEWLREQGAEE
ncbi:MAG: hypothetical protein KatS3mg026_0303 [Bacteroidia bacterium]|nr:MAG: hypothetical protein KatS3mg026_0303 [Bacteroidia bacterium]